MWKYVDSEDKFHVCISTFVQFVSFTLVVLASGSLSYFILANAIVTYVLWWKLINSVADAAHFRKKWRDNDEAENHPRIQG